VELLYFLGFQKEAGLVLAARFALFTNDLPLASKMVQRLLSGSSGSGSAFEVEAIAVDMWIKVAEALDELKVLGSSGDVIRKLQDVERQFSQTGGQVGMQHIKHMYNTFSALQ
jgi:hypothetical protein